MIDVLFVDIPTFGREIPKFSEKLLSYKLILGAMRESKTLQSPSEGFGLFYSPGLLSMAAFIERAGFKAAYFSWNHGNHNKADQLGQLLGNTRNVAVTSYTTTAYEAIQICKLAKTVNPNIRTILGGYHVTSIDEETIGNNRAVDVVVRGEGEYTLLELLTKPNNLDLIRGITYYSGDGVVRRNEGRLENVAVEELPMAAYHLLGEDFGKYIHNIWTQRGCPYRCSFCAESRHSKGVRRKSVGQVIEELKYLSSRLPADAHIFFDDSIFLIDKKWTVELCEQIRKNRIHLTYSCNVRPEVVEPNMIRTITQSGFNRLCIGIENADDGILKTVNKGRTYNEIVNACKIIRANSNAIITAYWITGLPGTTLNSLFENTEQMKLLIQANIVDEISNKVCVPYPGTAIGDDPRQFGIQILSNDWSKYDRLSLPVYRLPHLSEYAIYSNFWAMEAALVEALRERLGVSYEELEDSQMKPYFKHVWDNYIHREDS